MAKVISTKNLKVDLSLLDIQKFNDKINDDLNAIANPLDFEQMEKIFHHVLDILMLDSKDCTFQFAVKKNESKYDDNKSIESKDVDNTEEKISVNTDMMPSFFVSDINMIKNSIKEKDRVAHLINALEEEYTARVEIDSNIEAMQTWVMPDKYPLGKWPSAYSPSLMQQLAINIAISNQKPVNVFSVNGPPGTGKTTLLKEIIASNIVQRAILLKQYKYPDDAFRECRFQSTDSKYFTRYYILDSRLTDYGIIVASNNNAAVENISKELPIAKDVKNSNTDYFDVDKNKEIYFTEIANKLMKDSKDSKDSGACWGLISARLGNRSNINEFIHEFWFSREQINLLQMYNETDKHPDWETAKKSFDDKYIEVLKYQFYLLGVVKKVQEHTALIEELKLIQENLNLANKQYKECNEKHIKLKNERDEIISKIEATEQNIRLLVVRVTFLKKIVHFFFRNVPVLMQIDKFNQELDGLTIALTNKNQEINNSNKELEQSKENLNRIANIHEKKQAVVSESNKEIENYKVQFGNNFVDEDFWADIQKNETSHLAAPWTDKKYDTLREELFYESLMLHKAFILNSKRINTNMRCFANLSRNQISEQDKALSYVHLLNTLLLVVPVVSTTFASVETFLNHVGKEELGMLIIDEAGQATPFSALGALWRTKKAIIVGDPLQVEPVVTVPKELSRRFAEEFKIPKTYRSYALSVQSLADHNNMFGGYREQDDYKLWLGCPLVIHRRCIEPMFTISNNIAYNGRMFRKTSEPKEGMPLLLKESIWINVKGKARGNKDHFVYEQGQKVIEMVLEAIELQNALPNLYIISPFKSVANNIKKMLGKAIKSRYSHYDIEEWIKKSCGTVHTFQGKEANEVILVLGCDKDSGKGAAAWAGNKPNILNVAVSRAKYRLAIIGDIDLWKSVPNFDFAYKKLYRK